MFDTIISVHTPKVAGSSFLHQIKNIYGENNLLQDYQDDPVDVRSKINIDPASYYANPITSIGSHKIVHGHFHPGKYDQVPNAFRLTFLRHPVDNVISIYRFWCAHDQSAFDSPIFQYFKNNSLSLAQFAMLPKIRYLYSEVYFGGFDMSRFDFIGDYLKYNDELQRLGRLLNIDFDIGVKLNVTSSCQGDNKRVNDVETGMDLPLWKILEQDIRFYERYAGR